MEIVFDPAKDAKNIKKHDGVSLADAKEFESDSAVIWPDLRKANLREVERYAQT